jgi:hypothetical protein
MGPACVSRLQAAAPSEPLEPFVLLSESAARLAQLHSGLLRGCSDLALAAELDLLMNLLAVSPGVRTDPQLAHLTLLWCGELAQQYACCVLQAAGAGAGPAGLGCLLRPWHCHCFWAAVLPRLPMGCHGPARP